MAFWSKKSADTKAEPKKAPAKKVTSTAVAQTASVSAAAADAILRPHVTEKAGVLAQSGVYTFVVAKNAGKSAIAKAVNATYKVKPVKIAVINLPAKNVFVKGRWGRVSGSRKAMVTLKKGDKIDFV